MQTKYEQEKKKMNKWRYIRLDIICCFNSAQMLRNLRQKNDWEIIYHDKYLYHLKRFT